MELAWVCFCGKWFAWMSNKSWGYVCHVFAHCVTCECLCVLLEGRAQAGRCIFTTSPRCLEQKLCCRKIMWLCEFHPCHVIRAQGRVWEVLSRSVRFLLPRETGCEGERRHWRQTCGWMQVGPAKSWGRLSLEPRRERRREHSSGDQHPESPVLRSLSYLCGFLK